MPKRDVGEFNCCGSYYGNVSYADELWIPGFLDICQELDKEFPAARLLPEGSMSIGLSETEKQRATERLRVEGVIL